MWPTRVDDAPSAGRTPVRVVREADAGVRLAVLLDVPPAGLDPVTSADRFRLRIEHEDPGARVLVAVDVVTDEVVGLASAGLSRDADAPTPWELYSITTLTSVHGSGLADELLAAAIGDRAVSLWVLVPNARAQAFYRRHGFAPDGAVTVHEASGVDQVRMVRAARPGRPAPDRGASAAYGTGPSHGAGDASPGGGALLDGGGDGRGVDAG